MKDANRFSYPIGTRNKELICNGLILKTQLLPWLHSSVMHSYMLPAWFVSWIFIGWSVFNRPLKDVDHPVYEFVFIQQL